MKIDEFREFLRDRISNACGDPMGLEAAVEEIAGAYELDVQAAFRNGEAGRKHVLKDEDE